MNPEWKKTPEHPLDSRLERSPESTFEPALELALRSALRHLNTLDARPVNATADAETLRRQLFKPLGERGLPADVVVADLVRDVEGGLLGSAGGRFYAWVIG